VRGEAVIAFAGPTGRLVFDECLAFREALCRSMHSFLTRRPRCRDTRPSMPLIETEEAARRLARAIASDLSLYNEEKIVNGITNDNLFESLAEEIEEGRALYKRRVAPELYPKNYYDRALVDILIKAKGHIKSKIW